MYSSKILNKFTNIWTQIVENKYQRKDCSKRVVSWESLQVSINLSKARERGAFDSTDEPLRESCLNS